LAPFINSFAKAKAVRMMVVHFPNNPKFPDVVYRAQVVSLADGMILLICRFMATVDFPSVGLKSWRTFGGKLVVTKWIGISFAK
jgi:hypothetical protein